MAGPLKKCFNCRILLPEDATNTTQCAKCQKNEAKYGKAGTCQYCQLNAAFHDQKCVWCSHAERKFGNPSECGHCRLHCAFPRHEREKTDGTVTLCRLCILQARQTNQTVLSGIPVPKEKPEKSSSGEHHHHHHQSSSSHRRDDRHHRHRSERERQERKRRHEEEKKNGTSSSSSGGPSSSSTGVNPLLPTNENGNGVGFPVFGDKDHGESMVKQQKMEDEIRRLKSVIQEKDQVIFEKDKQISNLKADKYNMEKKHRERVHQLNKEKEESIRAIEQIKKKKN